LEEIVIVFSNLFGVGVLGSQLAFADGEGALLERLGSLVLPQLFAYFPVAYHA